MHLKPTAGCQISILIFEKQLWKGGLYKYPIKIYEERQSSFPTFICIKGIARVFNWLMCLGGIMKLKAHSRVSNINFDIWKKIVEGGLYEYPIKNISRTAKFLPNFI